jgi:hydroxymethylpyrimidine pyrophosphatase-like HAD family hydrolase
VENGGLWFVRDAAGRLYKRWFQPARERTRNRVRLTKLVGEAMARVPGARLSMDSASTEVDLAVDYNEGVKLGHAAADALESYLRARGVQAVRSSVHVNCWIGGFDKRAAVERFLADEWGERLKPRDRRWAWVGDSFNDAPLFEAFALSVGVANVHRVLDRLDCPPAFVTRSAEGAGARELIRAILRDRP